MQGPTGRTLATHDDVFVKDCTYLGNLFYYADVMLKEPLGFMVFPAAVSLDARWPHPQASESGTTRASRAAETEHPRRPRRHRAVLAAGAAAGEGANRVVLAGLHSLQDDSFWVGACGCNGKHDAFVVMSGGQAGNAVGG